MLHTLQSLKQRTYVSSGNSATGREWTAQAPHDFVSSCEEDREETLPACGHQRAQLIKKCHPLLLKLRIARQLAGHHLGDRRVGQGIGGERMERELQQLGLDRLGQRAVELLGDDGVALIAQGDLAAVLAGDAA